VSSAKSYKFLVFGNPLLDNDSLPLRLMGPLRKRFPSFEFREFDPSENLEREGRDLMIIDTAEGIEKVTLLTDIDSIATSKIYSMHDFDLGFSLKLLKKAGYIDSARVFCVPMGIGEDLALSQLADLIASSLP
jgi:hypothetical protein